MGLIELHKADSDSDSINQGRRGLSGSDTIDRGRRGLTMAQSDGYDRDRTVLTKAAKSTGCGAWGCGARGAGMGAATSLRLPVADQYTG